MRLDYHDVAALLPTPKTRRELQEHRARRHQEACYCQPCEAARRFLLAAGMWRELYDSRINPGLGGHSGDA